MQAAISTDLITWTEKLYSFPVTNVTTFSRLVFNDSTFVFGLYGYAYMESWSLFSYDKSTQFITPNLPSYAGSTPYIKAKAA